MRSAAELNAAAIASSFGLGLVDSEHAGILPNSPSLSSCDARALRPCSLHLVSNVSTLPYGDAYRRSQRRNPYHSRCSADLRQPGEWSSYPSVSGHSGIGGRLIVTLNLPHVRACRDCHVAAILPKRSCRIDDRNDCAIVHRAFREPRIGWSRSGALAPDPRRARLRVARCRKSKCMNLRGERRMAPCPCFSWVPLDRFPSIGIEPDCRRLFARPRIRFISHARPSIRPTRLRLGLQKTQIFSGTTYIN